MSKWHGCIDGVRVDRVAGGYAAGHPAYPGVVVRDCPWLAAWHVARGVRIASGLGLIARETKWGRA